MKKYILLLIITIFTVIACDSTSDDSNELKITMYNSTDGLCALAQETIDYYIDGDFAVTIKPGENKKHSISKGKHILTTFFTDTDKQIGDSFEVDIKNNEHWYHKGCDNGTHPESKTGLGTVGEAPLKLSKIEYYFDSLPTNFFGMSSTNTVTQYAAFIPHYEELSSFIRDDIYKVYHYSFNEKGWWNFDPAESHNPGKFLNTTDQKIEDSYEMFYSTDITENGSALVMGEYFVKVVFKDGSVAKRIFTIDNDGITKNDNSVNYIYSNEYTGTANADYVAAVDRPVISAGTKGPNILVTFKVSDSRINDGLLLFYDTNGNYIAQSKTFKSSTTAVRSFLNSGTAYNIDGTDNSITITDADIKYEDTKSLSDITHVSVVAMHSNEFLKAANEDFGYIRTWSSTHQF